MRVLIEDAQEAAILENRFQALAYQLGPTVELHAVLPDGRVLHRPQGGLTPSAQCQSLNEKLELKLHSLGNL